MSYLVFLNSAKSY